MAGLQLEPNPILIAAQATIFLASLYVVKKLFVAPYAELRSRRMAATVGSKDSALAMLKQNELHQQSLTRQTQEAIEKSRQLMAEAKAASSAERAKIIAAAEQDAASTLSSMRDELKRDISAEKAKLPGVVASLTERMFEKLVH